MRTRIMAALGMTLALAVMGAGLADGQKQSIEKPGQGAQIQDRLIAAQAVPLLPPGTLPPVMLPVDPTATVPVTHVSLVPAQGKNQTAKTAGASQPPAASITQPATVVPAREVRVSPLVKGQVLEVLVEEGTQVKAGQLLARLDPREYDLEYKHTLALLERARALLAVEEAKARNHDEEVKQAEAETRQAEAQRDFQGRKTDRMREMQKAAAVDSHLVDEAESQLHAADARVVQMAAKQRIVQQDSPKGRLAVAKAEVNCAQANCALAKMRLDNAGVRAPISGTILTKRVEVGEVVRPALRRDRSTEIFTIADLNDLDVIVEIPENSIGRIRPGQKCVVNFDSRPNQHYSARVSRIKPTISTQTRTATVHIKLEVPKNERVLRPGMYGQAEILTTE